MSSDLLEAKRATRLKMRRRLEGVLPTLDKVSLDRQIQDFVHQLTKDENGLCAAFRGLHDEPDLWPLCAEQMGRWVFPRIEGDHLRFFKPSNQLGFELNRLGIAEPRPSQCEEVSLERCSAVLIPGVGFDRHGLRLGRGKGFYDRALSGFKGRKIGVCYSFQIANNELPRAEWDLAMDVVVTEKYLLWPLSEPRQQKTG